jgi:hypothetical protein
MIGTFPRGEHWVTLQLAADHHEDRPRLLELFGACPGDPEAQLARTTICESAEAALAHAATRMRDGWAAYASVDEPGDVFDAAAAVHAPACTAPVAATDTALTPEPGVGGGRARRGRDTRAVLPVSQPDRRPSRVARGPVKELNPCTRGV